MRLLHEACRRLITEASQSRQQSFRPACPCRHRAVLTRSTSSRATLLFHGLSARAIASTTGWRASVLTSLCSNRGLAGDMYLNCLRTRNAVTVHASVKRRERSCHQAKGFRRIYRMRPRSIDRGRFRHRASEFTKLRTHFFHLLFQMVLVNRAHLLGIFCLKQTLCELEPSIHICLGKRYCLFV